MFSDVCLLGAPHTSQTCFFFLGRCFCSLTFACWALRTRRRLAFSFWRVLLFSGVCLLGAPHTSQTCFFFLAGAFVLWRWQGGRSAHVTNLLFLFGGYFCSLMFAWWTLRTRRKLAFSFWRVLLLSDVCLVGAPHTSQTCFFFLAGAFVLWNGRGGRSAHVADLLFLFWRVLLFSGMGEVGAPHTSQTCFFFLTCTFVLWRWRGGRSAHVTNLLFLFGRVLTVLRSCLLRKFPFRHDPSRLPGHAYSTNSLSGMTRLPKTRLRTRTSRITAPPHHAKTESGAPRRTRSQASQSPLTPHFSQTPPIPISCLILSTRFDFADCFFQNL